MKKSSIIILCLVFQSITATSQTYDPSCYSNADGWKITKIETLFNHTYVTLDFYSYKKNYEFWINPGMYIENYNNPFDKKYYIKSFSGYELNSKYKLEPYTKYTFTLIFEKIPESWRYINIAEPESTGYSAWYWKYISLNKPSNERLNAENFLLTDGIKFLKTFVHPTNTFVSYRYSLDFNSIRVTLYYKSYVTDLELKFNGKQVTHIREIYDNDFVEPFYVLETIKDWVQANDKQKTFSSEFERKLNKGIDDMTGRELACVGLTVLWNLN